MIKNLLLALLACASMNGFCQTQYQHWEWAKSFGGNGNDITKDMKVKNGCLYVTGNFTSPQINWDGTTLTNQGGQDIFVARLDTLGNTIWVKSFGGNGDDQALQLEINSAGAMVLRCTSGSNSISIGNSTLNNPANFYMVLDVNGNVLNTVVLPEGPAYNDIDLDNSTSIYVSGAYQHPFMFNGTMIDSSFGLSGAVLLKYNGNSAAWYKNLQVRMNQRFEIFDYDIDPYDPSISPFVGYTPPITGDAGASMQIEYNEHESVLGVMGNLLRNGAIDSLHITYDYAYEATGAKSLIYGLKISTDGRIKNAKFHNPWTTFSGNHTAGFTTGLSGYSYTTSGYQTLGGYIDYTITCEKNNRQLSSLSRGYEVNNGFGNPVPPEAWFPFQTDESGIHLLCTDFHADTHRVEPEKSNVIILDTNLNSIKKTAVKEINFLPLSVRAMSNTHAIFFGSTFSNSALIINENLPGNEINLPNSGQCEILIGKYICDGLSLPQLTYPYKTSYKTCNASDSVKLSLNVADSFGAAPFTFHWQASSHFSDTTILNPTVYFGTDSIVNKLTITDANGMKFIKDFVFFGGKPADIRLMASNTNLCSNDTLVLSLAGTTFAPVEVTGIPSYYNQSADARTFTSIDKQIKYPASYSHAVQLNNYFENDDLSPSPFCFSTAPININVSTAFIDTKTIYVCPGSDYSFADSTTQHDIQHPFTHTIHYSKINGCDSNYVINVLIAPVYSKIKNRSICAGGDYYFPDNTVFPNITSDTSYTCHYTSVYGCDSNITYNIHVNPVPTTIVDAPVCSGGSYILHYFNYTDVIQNISSDTTYEIHLYTQKYCDSIVKVHIRIVSQFDVSEKIFLCPGSSYNFPDGYVINNISSNISHISRLTAVGGCDSIVTTDIIMNPIYKVTQYVSVCPGSNYTFPDGSSQIINSNINHNSRLLTIHGCDSIIITNVNAYTIYNSTENINACKGSSYTFPDGTMANNISSSLQHVSHLIGVHGCDSIINSNINLVVIDTSITKTGLELKSNSNLASYQWLDCTTALPIATANAQRYTATSIGSYAVVVSDQGCVDTSSCYIITAANLLNGGRPLINAYPVPTRGVFTLMVQSERATNASISLLDFTGNLLRTEIIPLRFGKNNITENIGSLPRGTYTLVLRIAGSDEVITRMIIKI